MSSLSNDAWITGTDAHLSVIRLIDAGSSGEVHEVCLVDAVLDVNNPAVTEHSDGTGMIHMGTR
jgi:hypothetical protein